MQSDEWRGANDKRLAFAASEPGGVAGCPVAADPADRAGQSDLLTGLYDRRYLNNVLRRELGASAGRCC